MGDTPVGEGPLSEERVSGSRAFAFGAVEESRAATGAACQEDYRNKATNPKP